MDDLSAQRTLVKSPPELWAEISDVESLARRLGEFGDVRITQLEPETTVAWEGERIRGTVNLEPSGWGTKVTLAAELLAVEAAGAAEPEPIVLEAEPEPDASVAAEAEPEDVAVVEPEAVAAPEAIVEPEAAVEPEAVIAPEAIGEPEAVVAPEPVTIAPAPAAAKPGGFFARLFRRKAQAPAAEVPAPAPEPVLPDPDPVPPAPDPDPVPVVPEPAPEPIVPPEPDPTPVVPEPAPELAAEPSLGPDEAQAILVSVLDDLGAAHHRPFSRRE